MATPLYDVQGSVFSGGPNRSALDLAQRNVIVDDMPGSTDAAKISAAVARVQASGGGVVQFLARTYYIDQTINLSGCHNTTLRGMGAAGRGRWATGLVWTGGASPMIRADLASDGNPNTDEHTEGLRVFDLGISGNGGATHCLYFLSTSTFHIADCIFAGATNTQVYIDVVPAVGDTQNGVMERCSVQAGGSAHALVLGPNSGGNSNWLAFRDMYLDHQNGDGWVWGGSDSNYAYNVRIGRGGGGTGRGMVFSKGVNGPNASVGNKVEWLQVTNGGDDYNGVVVEVAAGSDAAPDKNEIVFNDVSGSVRPNDPARLLDWRYGNEEMYYRGEVYLGPNRDSLTGAWSQTASQAHGQNGVAPANSATVLRTHKVGKTVRFNLDLTVTTNGSAGGYALTVPLPYSAKSPATGSGIDSNGAAMQVYCAGGLDPNCYIRYPNGAYPGVDGMRYLGSLEYEAS